MGLLSGIKAYVIKTNTITIDGPSVYYQYILLDSSGNHEPDNGTIAGILPITHDDTKLSIELRIRLAIAAETGLLGLTSVFL